MSDSSDPDQIRTEALATLLSGARWFGGKGRDFTVRDVRRLGTLPGQVGIDLVEVAYADGETEAYQVPVVHYPAPQERLGHALIGAFEDPDFGLGYSYDAVHDRDAMAHWLAAFLSPAESESIRFTQLDPALTGHELDPAATAALFTGEQSNSSVAFGEDGLLKLFRRVTPGRHPDVELHEVLTRSGSEEIAALYGWLEVPGTSADEPLVLGMLQQFLRTASDGFELAKASVRDLYASVDLSAADVGGDFASESTRLGECVAAVHRGLADRMPTETLTGAEIEALRAGMDDRLARAVDVVPELGGVAEPLRAIFNRLSELDQMPVQRIHGDLHLGQTLRTVKGWKLVDFEGEPAKSLTERRRPDSPWRDVAGMLRSFDYAPAVVEQGTLQTDESHISERALRAAEWTARNRTAFVTGYLGAEPSKSDEVLLAAYEADKAIYEAVYEARNRPDWLPIPLAGISRITEGAR